MTVAIPSDTVALQVRTALVQVSAPVPVHVSTAKACGEDQVPHGDGIRPD
jgi:hypothetical protein